MNNALLVNEIFGPTWQGEGQSVGKLCYFIRVSHCNQACVFCDTFYTWAFNEEQIKDHLYADKPVKVKDEVHRMTVENIWRKVIDLWWKDNKNSSNWFSSPLIVISGGEPMLQSQKLIPLIDRFFDYVDRFEIETAGTIFDQELVLHDKVFFNVSPKLESSGNAEHLRYKPDVLRMFEYSNKAIFKFVICDDKDFEEIDQIVDEVQIPDQKIYVMIEGITKEKQEEGMKKYIPQVLQRSWNYTPRLHVSLFGNKRGT